MRHVFRSHDELTSTSLHLHVNTISRSTPHYSSPSCPHEHCIRRSHIIFFVVQLIARDPKRVLVVSELFGFPPHKFIHYQDVDQATDRLQMHQSITVHHLNRKEPDDVIPCCSNDCYCRLSFVYAPPTTDNNEED